MRADGLGPSFDRALRHVIDHRGQVVRFDFDDDVSEGAAGGEVHDADRGRLLAEADDRPVPLSAGEELAPGRIANPLCSDPLPETTEIARRPHQDAVANFDLGIGEEILDGRGHRFRRFRRAARRLDADAEHAVAIRRAAFNFLERSPRVDEGYLWTCWPGPPDA